VSSHRVSDMSDPWHNVFNSPGGASTPAPPVVPGTRRKRDIPDQDELFTVQKDLVKALSALDELEHINPELDTRALRQQLQNGYKVLNRFLRTHAV
jgi:hypothetical protein